jgi:plastocyanin
VSRNPNGDRFAVKEPDVAFPKILLGVPIAVAGIFTPAIGHAIDKPAMGAIGMNHEGYSVKVVTIHVGDRLTFTNDSRFIHIIGAGTGGHLRVPGNEPIRKRVLVQTNKSYTTGAWTRPGVYYMTCSVHPEMTIKIVVRS